MGKRRPKKQGEQEFVRRAWPESFGSILMLVTRFAFKRSKPYVMVVQLRVHLTSILFHVLMQLFKLASNALYCHRQPDNGFA